MPLNPRVLPLAFFVLCCSDRSQDGGPEADGPEQEVPQVETRDTDDPELGVQASIDFFVERVPGSAHHHHSGTWWGFNQRKITRYGDKVFMYVVENDDIVDSEGREAADSTMRIYVKEGLDGAWTAGAGFATGRPGNIVVDSQGALHAFAIRPLDITVSNQQGPLMHYYFPDARSGDITNHSAQVAVPSDGETSEQANIRFGAAIGPGDRLAIGFGQDYGDGLVDTQELYTKSAGGDWVRSYAASDLLYNMYYTYVLVLQDGHAMFSGMDDARPDGGTAWNLLTFWQQQENTWRADDIADHLEHTNSADYHDYGLVQQDLFASSDGRIHVLWRGPGGFYYHRVKGPSATWSVPERLVLRTDLDFIRVVEAEGNVYFVGGANNNVFFLREGADTFYKIDHGVSMNCAYTYVTAPGGGTRPEESYVDLLALNGCDEGYSPLNNVYIRVPKTEFARLYAD